MSLTEFIACSCNQYLKIESFIPFLTISVYSSLMSRTPLEAIKSTCRDDQLLHNITKAVIQGSTRNYSCVMHFPCSNNQNLTNIEGIVG